MAFGAYESGAKRRGSTARAAAIFSLGIFPALVKRATTCYIDSCDTASPLIHGDFTANTVQMINGTFTSAGTLAPNAGVKLPNSFDPDPVYVGTIGNFAPLGHAGASEDFLGYANNSFYSRDSLGGADVS